MGLFKNIKDTMDNANALAGQAAVMQQNAYAAQAADAPLAPFGFDRRDPGPADVAIDILFCGVCHSDLHTARGEWDGTLYPCVPGHEIVGHLVGTCERRGCRLSDLSDEELAAAHPALDAGVRAALGVGNAVAAFRSAGSTAPDRVAEQIAQWKDRLG